MGYWNKTCLDKGGKYGVAGMLLYKQSQREGIHAANVGPMDTLKPTIKANKEATVSPSAIENYYHN